MPTDYAWVGAVAPGDLSVAANYFPAAVPSVEGDTLVFGPTANQSDIIAGLSTFNAVNFALVHRHPLFTGAFGESGNPVKFVTEADAGQVIIEGVGKAFVEAGSGGNARITYLYVETDNQSDTIEIGGVLTTLTLIKGRSKLLSGSNASLINVTYRTNKNSDTHYTHESSSGLSTMNIAGGIVARTGTGGITTVLMSDGTLDSGPSVGVVTNYKMTGGRITHRAIGTVLNCEVLGGTLDYSVDPRPKTITQLRVFRGGIFLPNANTTIGNDPPGGSIYPLIPVIP